VLIVPLFTSWTDKRRPHKGNRTNGSGVYSTRPAYRPAPPLQERATGIPRTLGHDSHGSSI
jgi:hypothetical protein